MIRILVADGGQGPVLCEQGSAGVLSQRRTLPAGAGAVGKIGLGLVAFGSRDFALGRSAGAGVAAGDTVGVWISTLAGTGAGGWKVSAIDS